MASLPFVLLALIAGAALACQVAINGVLAQAAGHVVIAAIISFVIGLGFLATGLLVLRIPLPAYATLTSLPVWAWLGGALGAVYVALSIAVVPKLGTAALVAFVVAGQMIASLTLDHFGAFGLAEHNVNSWRVLGAILLTAGVTLIRLF